MTRKRRDRRYLAALAALVAACSASAAAPAVSSALDGGPAAAPGANLAWWPPTANGSLGPRPGWALSPEGPMAMPAGLQGMLYASAGPLGRVEKLRLIFRKIWEHLASRVDVLGELEHRSGLLEREVNALVERPVGGDTILARLFKQADRLERRATVKHDELKLKVDQLQTLEDGLAIAFSEAREEVRLYFRELREARKRTSERYAKLRRRVNRVKDTLVGVRKEWMPGFGTTASAPLPSTHRGRDGRLRARMEEAKRALMAEMREDSAQPMPPAALGPAGPAGNDQLYASAAEPPPGPPPMTRQPRRSEPVRSDRPVHEGSLYGPEGRRRSARSLVQERIRMLQRGARGPQSWEEQRGEPLGRLEAPDAPSAMPPAQGQPAARAGGGLPPPGGSQGDWWDPSVPAEEAEGQAPDADELLQDFLEDPDVMDGYLSKAAAEQKGTLLAKRALQPGKAGAFLPSAEEAGLGAFAARLERELEQTARDEGLEIRERFQPRAAPDVGPARSGERSVRSILEELDALEAAPSTAPAR